MKQQAGKLLSRSNCRAVASRKPKRMDDDVHATRNYNNIFFFFYKNH